MMHLHELNSNLGNAGNVVIKTKIPTSTGNSILATLPDGFNAENTYILGYKFTYSNTNIWYTDFMYFEKGSNISINIMIGNNAISMYIDGPDFVQFTGKDMYLYIAKME